MIFIILPELIKDKLQIQQIVKLVILGQTFLPIGKLIVKINTLKNFINCTKTSSPAGKSGTTSLPPIGDGPMFIETSSSIHGANVFVVSSEQIIYKLLISPSSIIDFQF